MIPIDVTYNYLILSLDEVDIYQSILLISINEECHFLYQFGSGGVNDCFTNRHLVFTCLQYKSFESTIGKGEIALNKQFLLFPQFFSIANLLENFLPFSSNLKLSSAISFSFEESYLSFGKGLTFTK